MSLIARAAIRPTVALRRSVGRRAMHVGKLSLILADRKLYLIFKHLFRQCNWERELTGVWTRYMKEKPSFHLEHAFLIPK